MQDHVFKDPKVGDKIAVESWRSQEPRAEVVEKVTATQVVTRGGWYRRDTGWLIGRSKFYRTSARPWTPDIDAKVDKDRLKRALLERQYVTVRAFNETATIRYDGLLTEAQIEQVEALTADVGRRLAEMVAQWKEGAP